MFIEEKRMMVPQNKIAPSLSYLSGLCGSGKTEIVCRMTADYWRFEKNILYVVPTIQLIEEIGSRLKKCGVDSVAIHSGDKSDKSVPSRIIEHLKGSVEFGAVLIITWNSYQMLPFFPGKDNWKVVIDEIPQVDAFRELSLPKHPGFIKDEVKVEESGIEGLLSLRAKESGSLEKRMEGDKDSVLEVFREFYGFITSKNHEVFVLENDWNRFVEKDGTFQFLSMLNSNLFRDCLLLGANVESSLLVKWLRKRYKITIGPDEELESHLRFRSHSFGDRAQVKYFDGVDDWSKCLRDKGNKNKVTNISLMDTAVDKFFGDRKFLVVANNDHKSKFENGVRIPVVCHGLDSYKDFTGIYISAALNRTTRHIRLLNLLGLTSEDIWISTAVEVYYQAVMRTNLRMVESNEVVDIIVPDKSSATSLRELLSSRKIDSIALPLVLGTKSLTRKERDARYYEKRVLQRDFPETRQNFFTAKKNSRNPGNDSLNFSFTIHRFRYDKMEKQFTTYMWDDKSLIALLRTSSKTPRRTKEESNLINAGIYDNRVVLKPNESFKTGPNFVQSSFLMLDFDNGKITPQDFISMFGSKAPIEDRLPFVITNTFSTSPTNPNRFRVFIFFATPAISIQEHNAIYDLMVYLLERKGWKKELLGLDPGTRSPILSCYLPGTNMEHQDYAFFENHNTRRREIQQFGLVPSWIPTEEEQQFQPILDDSTYGTIPQDQVDQITAEFRSMREGRYKVWWRTSIKLARARYDGKRLSPPAIQQILWNLTAEKHYRKRVKDAIKFLQKVGHIQ